jgi:hypothetical protein
MIAFCHIMVLVATALTSTAVSAQQVPALGPTYHHGKSSGGIQAVSATETLRIQSVSSTAQAPVCDSDASCQALCPTDDITTQQPALSDAAVAQQVRFRHALSCTFCSPYKASSARLGSISFTE